MDERRVLPSVDRVLGAMSTSSLPVELRTRAAREAVSRARAAMTESTQVPAFDEIVERAERVLAGFANPELRRVINASGVILQTNLGRAPLSDRAMAAMREVAAYSNLEFDLAAGERGSRHNLVSRLLRETTGAEDGIVVNNNAAALFMVLRAFASGREVVVSRGEAVEIGGGFRIPDVLRESGARLVEVGTTNRTYARDYESAVTAETAAFLRVHTSNFQVVGFVASPSLADLVAVARQVNVLCINDLGSGCLVDTRAYGLEHEPTVQESVSWGADLSLFSGDKLLGGPQCGVIVGRRDLIATLKRHPLARALRVDKTTIAALEATLLAYLTGTERTEIPVWRMMSTPVEEVQERARAWAQAARGCGEVVASRTMIGGGSLPGAGVETLCTAITASDVDAGAVAARFRASQPAIIGRIERGQFLLDPRTVDPADDGLIEVAIRSSLAMV